MHLIFTALDSCLAPETSTRTDRVIVTAVICAPSVAFIGISLIFQYIL